MIITIVTGDRYTGIAYGGLSSPILLAILSSLIISRALIQNIFIVLVSTLILIMVMATLAFFMYDSSIFKSEEDTYGVWQVVKISAISIIIVLEVFYQFKTLINKNWNHA
jgi:hypothetical protein